MLAQPESLGDQFYLVNNVFYLACMVPLACWLAWVLFGPRAAESPSPTPGSGRAATRIWIREPQSSLL